MTQSLTTRCKLIVPVNIRDQVDETLKGFADACNQILQAAKKENCWNTTKLHHLTYKPVRQSTGLKANIRSKYLSISYNNSTSPPNSQI